MGSIIRKGFINKRNKQITLTIPKKEFKKLNPNMKIKEGSLFEIRPLKRKK